MKKWICCLLSLLFLVGYGSVINAVICGGAPRNPSHPFLVIVIVVCIEEMLFRLLPYILWQHLLKRVPFVLIALISSVLFGLFHSSELQLLMQIPVGILFMYLLKYLQPQIGTRYSILVIIVIHLCYNYAIWTIF